MRKSTPRERNLWKISTKAHVSVIGRKPNVPSLGSRHGVTKRCCDPNDWERRSTTRIVSDTRSSRLHPLMPVSLATFWKAVGRTVITIRVLAASLGCSQQLLLVLVLRSKLISSQFWGRSYRVRPLVRFLAIRSHGDFGFFSRGGPLTPAAVL